MTWSRARFGADPELANRLDKEAGSLWFNRDY